MEPTSILNHPALSYAMEPFIIDNIFPQKITANVFHRQTRVESLTRTSKVSMAYLLSS
jgi:hypothetical protein